MSFQKFTKYRKRGGGSKISVRFTNGIAYLSSGFIDAASIVLRKEGTIEDDETIRFAEFFFDPSSKKIGIKPVGHKGLKDKDMLKRHGVRRVTGSKTRTCSVRGFQESCEIQDRTSYNLVPEKHKNPDLPEGQGEYIMFVSDKATLPSPESGNSEESTP